MSSEKDEKAKVERTTHNSVFTGMGSRRLSLPIVHPINPQASLFLHTDPSA
jgi:hypothetical protein